jgi:two-component system NtrC family sensor kinase
MKREVDTKSSGSFATSETAAVGGIVRVVLLYAVFASLWILLSDRAVAWLFSDPAQIILVSTIKGWGFVVVTSTLLYALMRRLLAPSLREREIQGEKLRALQLLDAIADGSTDVIFAKDRTGRYLMFNREAARVTAMPREAVLGRDDRAVFPPEEAEGIMANDQRTISSNQVRTFEEFVTTADGKVTFLSTKGPLRDADGNVVGIFGISRDITERKRIEEALGVERARLRTLINTIPDLVWLKDPQGVYLAGNPAFERLMGVKEEDLLGKTDYDFFPTELAEFFRGHDRNAVLAGKPTVNEEWVTFADDGHRALLETIKTPMLDHEGRLVGVLGIARDITNARRTEEALRETEANLLQSQRIAGIGHYVFEIGTGRWSSSEVMDEIFGIDAGYPRDVEGWLRLVHPDDRAAMGAHLRDHVLVRKQPFDKEYRIVRPSDGAIRWMHGLGRLDFDAGGSPIRMLGTIQDITESKRVEEALQESKDKVSQILDSTSEGIYGLDLFGNCTFCNPSGISMLGYHDEKDLIGSNMHERVHHTKADGSPYPKEECADRVAISKGEMIHRDKEILWRADGTSFTAEYWTHPISRGDDLIGTVVTFIDITERIALENQLLHAQKMEAVGTLAGGIAHDFNNILSAILGFTELLHMEIAADDARRENVEEILKAVKKASHLTSSLLSFSRKQVMTTSEVDLNDLIVNMGKLLVRLIGEDIEFRTELRRNAVSVLADKGQIEQVIMNLVTNARDAMPKGGTLTIASDLVEIDEAFCEAHGQGTPGRFALIAISDTGTGMDEETRKRIFDPFFTTKEPGKGTGLGLAMAHGIIQQHDGFIDVVSEHGRGAAFMVYLPAREAGAGTAMDVTPNQSLEQGTETILVAEDDPALRKLSKIVLETYGYTVILAEDGEDAVAKFADHQDEINLVMLDMIMPKKTGMEALEEIKDIRSGVKALFLSGYTADRIQEMTAEGVEIVMKPISPRDLVRTVRKVLESKP